MLANFLNEISKNTVVCDTVKGLSEPFDAQRYMGIWYQVMHSSNIRFIEDADTCTKVTFTDEDQAGYFDF